MPRTLDAVELIDERLRATAAALAGARLAAWRSPNADTLRVEAELERRVDDLLDQRLRATRVPVAG